MLKIRLRRQGAKFQPHYRVVVAESRSPRDGRFVTVLGYYDPRTNPSTIHLDGEQISDWIRKGAQPTDAVLRLMKQANVAAEAVAKIEAKRKKGGAPASGATTVAEDAAAETADQA